MEQVLFGVGLIAMVITWSKLWRPLVLDKTRDKLFDLRDKNLKEYFLQRNLPLTHPIYKAMRDLLNGHLRHTEKLTFIKFVLMSSWGDQHPEPESEIRQRIEKRFRSDDLELNQFSSQVRMQAAMIMLEYMVESSLLAFLAALFGLFVGVAYSVVKSVLNFAKGFDAVTSWALFKFTSGLLVVLKLFGEKTSDAQATMEEYALSF